MPTTFGMNQIVSHGFGMFLFAYREQWLMVAFLGIFISGTRNLGVMMVFPVLILALQAYGWREFFRFTERAFKVAPLANLTWTRPPSASAGISSVACCRFITSTP